MFQTAKRTDSFRDRDRLQFFFETSSDAESQAERGRKQWCAEVTFASGIIQDRTRAILGAVLEFDEIKNHSESEH